ncbi:MAG: XdhC family protein [Nitriliruptorales bacterium]|nr:XdhC family protein [Nitriliruptorales bacterium]
MPDERLPGTLVAIYASPVARYLLHWAKDLGYTTVLVEPDPTRIEPIHDAHADRTVARCVDAEIDGDTDVVATDHDRPDLSAQLGEVLRTPARWIGLMGSPRHTPPHIEPLEAQGFADDEIERIQRPIGLNIGSKTPPEIAIATLAGLIADRNDRPGGFYADRGEMI